MSDPVRMIKKYPNRRLYDTANSGYISNPNLGSDDKLSIIPNLSHPGALTSGSFGMPEGVYASIQFP